MRENKNAQNSKQNLDGIDFNSEFSVNYYVNHRADSSGTQTTTQGHYHTGLVSNLQFESSFLKTSDRLFKKKFDCSSTCMWSKSLLTPYIRAEILEYDAELEQFLIVGQ